jgi:plastocyanin
VFNTDVARRSTVMALVLLAVACSSGGGGPTSGQTVAIDGQQVVVQGTVDVGGQTAEDVDAKDYLFDPTVLSGSGGQTLSITVHNRGTATHNFSIPQQQISQDVAPGQSITVTVTFPAFGQLAFFCRFHRNRGMLGELRAGT